MMLPPPTPAVGKGQSVSFIKQNATPVHVALQNPLYSVSGGGLNLAIPLAEFTQPLQPEKDY